MRARGPLAALVLTLVPAAAGGVGATAGVDLYLGGGEESLYRYVRISWNF